MLGIGGGASVAGDEQLVAGLHGLGRYIADADERVGDVRIVKDSLHGGDGLGQLLLNEFLHGSPRGTAESLPRFVVLLCDFIAGVLLPD
jgi:hypothetical protein